MMTGDDGNDPLTIDDLSAGGSWSAAALKSACETLAFDSTQMLYRTRIEGAAPAWPGGGRAVGLMAKAVAEEFGLRTWLAYDNRVITVTFERRDARRNLASLHRDRCA